MMLAVNLDDEAEKYLIEILSQEKMTSQELVKKLLRNHLISLRSSPTILERMGGYPKDLLEGEVDLSDRNTRKQRISEYLNARNEIRDQS